VEVKAILAGFTVHAKPVDGKTTGVNVTVPVNPLKAVRIMVELPVPPDKMVTLTGDAATAKPWTVRVMIAKCVNWPFVPVMFRT
jgi:hypothetical protein